jgi:hypothetical protein
VHYRDFLPRRPSEIGWAYCFDALASIHPRNSGDSSQKSRTGEGGPDVGVGRPVEMKPA